jgi:tetratricopeptide (TPR) repeat protein
MYNRPRMTNEERAELEARADRFTRRGEMGHALALLESIARAFPNDETLRAHIADLSGSLQPTELHHPKANVAETRPIASRPSTPEQEGERLFAIGDYAGAAAAYRRALRDKPDSALVRERLEELYHLARAAPRHSPTDTVLPADPENLLSALLDRIAARRRA